MTTLSMSQITPSSQVPQYPPITPLILSSQVSQVTQYPPITLLTPSISRYHISPLLPVKPHLGRYLSTPCYPLTHLARYRSTPIFPFNLL